MPIHKVVGEKKDGLQKYKVKVSRTVDGSKKELTRIAYGLEEAKDLERKLQSELSKNPNAPSKKLTVQELYTEYKARNSNGYNIKESTSGKYQQDFTYHILPTLGKTRIDKLKPSIIEDWKTLIETKKLALSTRKNAFGSLSTVLNYAVSMEYLPKNPLSKIPNFKDVSQTKPDMKYYTGEDFSKFIAVAKQLAIEQETAKQNLNEWDYYVFFSIAFFTGLRKGEIHALKWCDINNGYLTVSRTLTQNLNGRDLETQPKSKSSMRTLQLPLPLKLILDEQRKRQEHLHRFSENFRVCGGERPLRDSNIARRNKKYANMAGLHRIRIHDYRHSHVSLLANERINIQEIARRLGHSRIEMTWNRYAHLYPREEERAIEVLNAIAA